MPTSTRPLVSVVVPTFQRPELLLRAVRSALAQTYDHLEVVVVVDGPCPETEAALRALDDPRVKRLVLPRHVGLADAVNAGVASAGGTLLALLDDDDEWLAGKLDMQVPLAVGARQPFPVVSCRLIARTASGDRIWPRRAPDPGEVTSEYLFCQRGLRGGEGMLLPSTLLMRTALFHRVRYTSGLPRHIDTDWLLRASSLEGFAVIFPDDRRPAVVWHQERGRARLSRRAHWREGLRFAQARRHLFTPRSYASFLLTVVSQTAAFQRRPAAIAVLLREAWRFGRPSLVDILAHLTIWSVPSSLRIAITARRDRRIAELARPSGSPERVP